MFCNTCGQSLPASAQGCWNCNTPVMQGHASKPVITAPGHLVPRCGPVGLGGWLLFFWFGLAVVQPLVAFGQIRESTHPLDIIIYVVTIALCLSTAYLIYREDSRALLYLRALLAFSMLAVLLRIFLAQQAPGLEDWNSVRPDKLWFRAGRVFLSLLAWWLYFRVSRRVHNTFGGNI